MEIARAAAIVSVWPPDGPGPYSPRVRIAPVPRPQMVRIAPTCPLLDGPYSPHVSAH
jgi:hypothetical protein